MYPILFELGPITIHTLWVFIALGILASAYTFGKLAKRVRLKYGWLLSKTIPILFITIVCARIFYIFSHLDGGLYTRTVWRIFALWDQGFSLWGTLFGFLISIGYFIRKKGESLWKWFDVLAPSLFIGFFLGNIGAFLDGRNYGNPTQLPWKVLFESAVVEYAVPIHPTQLYAALLSLMTFLALLFFFKKFASMRPGGVTSLALILGGASYFLEEFFRGDDTILIFGIRLPQILAGMFLIAGILLLSFDSHANQSTPKNRPSTSPSQLYTQPRQPG